MYKKTENHLLVAVSLPLDLPEYVDPVVVAQGPRHLVVVHRQVVLLDTPETGQTSRINDLEHTWTKVNNNIYASVLFIPKRIESSVLIRYLVSLGQPSL